MPIMFLQGKMNMKYVIKTLTLMYKISSTIHNDTKKDVFDIQQDSLPSLSPPPSPVRATARPPELKEPLGWRNREEQWTYKRQRKCC